MQKATEHPMRLVVPRRVAAMTTVLSLIDMFALHRPGLMHRLDLLASVLPGIATAVPGISVALGVLLFGLARGLSRGKRQAWRLAMLLLAAEAVLHIGQRHHITALLSLAALIAMYRVREQFSGLPDPMAPRRALLIGAGLLTLSFALGMLALSVLERNTNTVLPLHLRAIATVEGLVGVPSVLTAPEGRYEDVIYFLLLSLGLLTAVTTGYLLLRSTPAAPPRTQSEDELLRSLLLRYGGQDSLAYFASRDDRAIVTSPNGRACISYRVVAGTALAAGDPIGSTAAWPDAIVAFQELARSRAWVPAVVAASQAGAQMWMRSADMTALEFGDEAIVATLSLEGRQMRNVRHAVARAERLGYLVDIARLGDLSGDALAELRQCAANWRTGGPERGFSMALGRIDAVVDPDAVVVRAMLDGALHAQLLLVPWGANGLSLDLMRRRPDSVSGVNELMVSRLMAALPSLGKEKVSLNFAAFRDAFERAERIGADPGSRAWGAVLKFASRSSQADSLYRFNAKFEPSWEPRYLLYPQAAALPRIALAYLLAEGLLPIPRLRRRRA